MTKTFILSSQFQLYIRPHTLISLSEQFISVPAVVPTVCSSILSEIHDVTLFPFCCGVIAVHVHLYVAGSEILLLFTQPHCLIHGFYSTLSASKAAKLRI